jgi:hypothetical protein
MLACREPFTVSTSAEAWASLLEQFDRSLDRFLLFDAQCVPPLLELVCDLDVPHQRTIPPSAYAVKSIKIC